MTHQQHSNRLSTLKAVGFIALFFSMTPAQAITPEEVAIPRIIALSQTQNPTQATIDEVLSLAQEGSTNQMRQQFSWTALIQIGPSNSADQYAKTILDDAAAPVRSKQGALGYLAEHPAPWMVPYAEQYITSPFDGETRSMAAYLASALNLTAQVATIKQIITTSSYGEVRSEAAYGLARLIPVADFVTAIDASDMGSWDKTLAKQLNAFIQADTTIKDNDVGNKLSRSEFIFPLAAMRYLLESNKTELLKRYVINGDETTITIPNPGHKALLRLLGYAITGNINNVVITKKPLM